MKLNTKGAGAPVEITLPEGGVLVLKPWASGAYAAAQKAFGEVVRDGGSYADADVAFTAAAAAWGALSWSGVYAAGDDEDEGEGVGEPLVMTPDLVTLLVTTESTVFAEVDKRYVVPGLTREAEKKG